MAMDLSQSSRSRRAAEDREFRALYAFCFAIFLVAALMSRVLPARWRPWPPTDLNSRSVIGEARAATSAFLPFTMMG